MGVYINMKMPEDSDIIVIYSDGTARKYLSYTRIIIDEAKVISIPKHGRLIDANEFFKALSMDDRVSIPEAIHVQSIHSEVPTIIPASGGNENE